MSHYVYIVDKTNKLLISCGNVNYNIVLEDFELYKDIREYMDKLSNKPYIETPFIKLNPNEVSTLCISYEFLLNLSNMQTRLIACEYWYLHKDSFKLEVVGEEKLGNYKGYKRVE